MNNFNNFQQYGNPSNQTYETPVTNNQYFASPGFSTYPPVHSEGHFGSETFGGGNIPDQASYYATAHHYNNNTDSNGSSLHSHGAPDLQQQYRETPFNPHQGYETSYQNQLPAEYVSEQPAQNHGHAHTPTSFSGPSWQGTPAQPVAAQFNQRPMNFEPHNPQSIYQQRAHITPYTGLQNPQPSQRGTAFVPDHNTPVIPQQMMNGFDPRNGQAYFSPPSSQPVLPQFEGSLHDDGQLMQKFRATPAATQQRLMDGPMAVHFQHQQTRGAMPTIVPQPTPSNSQISQSMDITVQKEHPWERPDGCPFISIKNPPKTKIGTFASIKSLPISSDKPFVVKHDTLNLRVLPQRRTRLPCEIQKERDALSAKILSPNSLSESEKQLVEIEIQRLDNEPVVVADSEASKPLKESKPKATKRKISKMDSTTKKIGSSTSSSDDEENLEDTTAREIKLKPRPDDTLKAVEYDIINILWRDPKSPEPTQKAVGDNIHAFGNYVTDIWTKSKDLKSDLERAQEKSDNAKLESLQAALEDTFASIRTAIETAIKYGDRFTLTQLGTHKKLLGSLSILLRNRFASEDYNGFLPKAILKLVSLFVTVNTAFLTDRVKLDRVRQKYNHYLDEESKAYMEQIFDNARKRSMLEAEDIQDDGKKGDDAKKVTSSITKKSSASTNGKDGLLMTKAQPLKKDLPLKKATTEIKKIQPIDYSGLGSARKVSSVAAKANPQSSAKRPGDEDMDSRAPKKAATESAMGVPATAKALSTSTSNTSQPASTAITQARSRPSGSMLPGRARIPTKSLPKKAAPQQSSTSIIGGLLDQIQKPKEKPKQQEEPTRAPETPEETKLRLRKESRRHLRVTWKPDEELADIRVFEHDTAEDKGRDHNMLRDARDNRSEGQMLKQRFQENDDEDEEEKAKEVAIRSWYTPTPFLSELAISDEWRTKTFVTRGGTRMVDSMQKKVMENYESRELMTIYTSVSEIPETPRSPPSKVAETFKQPAIYVLPSDLYRWQESLPPDSPRRAEIHTRWSEYIQRGPSIALESALRRLKLASSSSPAAPQAYPSNRPTPRTEQENAAEVLRLLTLDKIKSYVDPDPYDPANPKTQRRNDYADPKVQMDIDSLETVFSQFKDKPFPTTEPPEHIQSNPDRVAEWHAGRNRDLEAQRQPPSQQPSQYSPSILYPSAPQLPDQYAAIIQQVKAIQASQSTAQPAQSAVAPVPDQLDPSVQNILAALRQTTAQPTAAPAYASNYAYPQGWNPTQAQLQANNGYNSYGAQPQSTSSIAAQLLPQLYSGQSQATPAYEGQAQSSQTPDMQNQRDNPDRGNRKDFNRGAKDHKGINRSLIGTKPCTFWAKGQCAKGDKCTFRHDPNDLI